MKILVLSDQKAEKLGLTDILINILSNHQTECYILDHKQFGPCIGCYGCWVKTPGICVFKDDKANEICDKEINCDAVVLLNEITYGGYSADIKAFLDRMISNISPFFELVNKEMHHKKRYERFPDWIAVGYGDPTEEERRIFNELNQRNAINLGTENHQAIIVKDKEELVKAKETIQRCLKEEAR